MTAPTVDRVTSLLPRSSITAMASPVTDSVVSVHASSKPPTTAAL